MGLVLWQRSSAGRRSGEEESVPTFRLALVGKSGMLAGMSSRKPTTVKSKQGRIDVLHRCPRERTAFVVVDMQHGFLDRGASLEVPKGRALIPAIRRLIAACRGAGVPVIFTQFIYSPGVPCLRGDPFGVEHLPAVRGQPTGYGHRSSNCLVGAEAGEGRESAGIVKALAPRAGELVVASHVYDKFLDTPLDLGLRCRGITHLMIAGVTTDICVNCTVLGAANRDYRVTVVSDGVATLDDAVQAACFNIWQRKFARLRTANQIMAELQRD
jgi:ureidoacrylate peracid hydrolase